MCCWLSGVQLSGRLGKSDVGKDALATSLGHLEFRGFLGSQAPVVQKAHSPEGRLGMCSKQSMTLTEDPASADKPEVALQRGWQIEAYDPQLTDFR